MYIDDMGRKFRIEDLPQRPLFDPDRLDEKPTLTLDTKGARILTKRLRGTVFQEGDVLTYLDDPVSDRPGELCFIFRGIKSRDDLPDAVRIPEKLLRTKLRFDIPLLKK